MNFERLLRKLCIRGGGPELPDAARLMEAEFVIPNMVCEGCAKSLTVRSARSMAFDRPGRMGGTRG